MAFFTQVADHHRANYTFPVDRRSGNPPLTVAVDLLNDRSMQGLTIRRRDFPRLQTQIQNGQDLRRSQLEVLGPNGDNGSKKVRWRHRLRRWGAIDHGDGRSLQSPAGRRWRQNW